MVVGQTDPPGQGSVGEQRLPEILGGALHSAGPARPLRLPGCRARVLPRCGESGDDVLECSAVGDDPTGVPALDVPALAAPTRRLQHRSAAGSDHSVIAGPTPTAIAGRPDGRLVETSALCR